MNWLINKNYIFILSLKTAHSIQMKKKKTIRIWLSKDDPQLQFEWLKFEN